MVALYRRTWFLLCAFLVVLLVPGSPTAASGTDRSPSQEKVQPQSPVWIHLLSRGGMPPGVLDLKVRNDGWMQVETDSSQLDSRRRIGSYAMQLSPRQLRQLREAVAEVQAAVPAGAYGQLVSDAYYVELTIAEGRQLTQIDAASGIDFPEPLKSLFEPQGRGLLGNLIKETLRKPVSAIEARIETTSRTVRVGSPFQVSIVFRNVGTSIAYVPVPSSAKSAAGQFFVTAYQKNVKSINAATEDSQVRWNERRVETTKGVPLAASPFQTVDPKGELRIKMPAIYFHTPGRYSLHGLTRTWLVELGTSNVPEPYRLLTGDLSFGGQRIQVVR